MKAQGLFLFLYMALFLFAQDQNESFPSVFNPPEPECDCPAVINNVNVTRSIEVSRRKFDTLKQQSFLSKGMYYLDVFHAGFTQTVHVLSANTDRQLAEWAGDRNATARKKKVARDGNATLGMADYFNRFFRDDTYLYSREASYLILRIGIETNKQEGPKFLNEVKFALSLPFTERHFQIFIGDPRGDDNEQVVDEEGNIDTKTTAGARYFVPEFIKNFNTDISAGFRGIDNPFAQLRMEYPMNFYDWLIRPVQYLEYSVKREAYEETDLYFNRKISRSEMVRLQLQRSTETQKIGMQYSATLSYFNTLRFKTGFRTFVGLAGETIVNEERYSDPYYDDVDPKVGVYRYSVGGGWKQSFLREWLFYEIEPQVNFDMLYNWRPNYVTRFWIEFYFGDI